VYCEGIVARTFDEIQVFDSVAERTGTRVDHSGVRGRAGVCRSLTELAAKSRRLGDGFYYLAESAWPADTVKVNLARPWTPSAHE
jgi:hypothetical protein